MNNFQQDLAFSEAASLEPFWEAAYKKAFPGYRGSVPCYGDTEGQRLGADRMIALSSGATLTVEEKVRRKTYPDIFLETWSNWERKIPGWVTKDLQIDFLAYAFLDTQRVYLWPWLPLRRAWLYFGEKWIRLYGEREAKNPGYTTKGVPVPIDKLQKAVQTAMIIDVAPQHRSYTDG